MVRNEEKYQQALQFRKRGFTYVEIAKICDVSKGTVSNWLKNEVFSQKITEQNSKKAASDNQKRLRLMNKARKAEREKNYATAKKSADTEYRHYKNDPLFVAGLMLYTAEGDMQDTRTIRIANVRPEVHRTFIRFLREYVGVETEKIHFWILLYSDLSEERCMRHWKRVTGLPYKQFYKNQIIQGKSKKRTLHYGVGNTIIGSTVLKVKLNRWLELIRKDLAK